jgi:hypothetical protein
VRHQDAQRQRCAGPGADHSLPRNVLREGCGDVHANRAVGTERTPRKPMSYRAGIDRVPDETIAALEQWIAAGAPP